MYGTVCPSAISFLSQLQNPLIAKYWKEGRKLIYRGNSIFPLSVMIHMHTSTVASSKQVTLKSYKQFGGKSWHLSYRDWRVDPVSSVSAPAAFSMV